MTAPSKLSTIFAGEVITAMLLDNTKATVRVRAMPARHLGRVLQLADKEAELLDFVCSVAGEQPDVFMPVEPGWSDNLTDESHTQLYEAAKRLNFSRAVTWAERQIAAKRITGELALKVEEVMTPLVKQLMEPMLQQIVGLLVSLSKPSASPAPETSTKS